jgi:hypothetical protein
MKTINKSKDQSRRLGHSNGFSRECASLLLLYIQGEELCYFDNAILNLTTILNMYKWEVCRICVITGKHVTNYD